MNLRKIAGIFSGILLMTLSACSDSTKDDASEVETKTSNLVSIAPTMNLVIVDNNEPNSPKGKSKGDINNDGLEDLIVQGQGGLVWYENNGSGDPGSFPKHTVNVQGNNFSYETDLEIGDMNGDGRNDIVTLASSTSNWAVTVLYGPVDLSADWGFTRVSPNGRLHDVELADMTGDGIIDVVARGQDAFGGITSGDTVYIFENDGTGSTSTTYTLSGPIGEGLIIYDLDSDGLKDVIVNSVWWKNDGDITDSFPQYTYAPSTWTEVDVHIDVGDINGDGRDDIVLAPSERENQFGKLSWFQAPEDRTLLFQEFIVEDNIETLRHSVNLADFNSDGRLDIASAEMHQSNDADGGDEVIIYSNTLLGWNKEVIDLNGSHSMRIVDVNSDGKPDLFGSNWDDGHGRDSDVKVWVNNTNQPTLPLDQWSLHVIDSARPEGGVFIFSEDLNGDNYPDIISADRWYINPHNLGGTWTAQPFNGQMNNAVFLFDFDGDNDIDVLGSQANGHNYSGAFAWARNDGAGVFTTITNIQSSSVGDFLQGVAVIDNTIALSWHSPGQNVEQLTIPADPSNDTWSLSTLSTSSQDEDLTKGDIDGDGNEDLFQGGQVLFGDGAGNWTPHVIAPFTGLLPDRNDLIDVDGDGDLDGIVGFEADVTDLVWVENPGGSLASTQTWTVHTIATNVGGGFSLGTGDADNDGDPDVVLGEHKGSTRVLIFENQSGGSVWTQHVVHEGGAGFDHHDGTKFVDLDLDGDLDIISQGWYNDQYVWVFENLALGNNAPTNIAPTVNAGSNVTIVDPVNSTTLNGSANDDGNPFGTLTYLWSQVSGPGSATFVDDSALNTSVSFSDVGLYTLRLTADDGSLTTSDDVIVNYVLESPTQTGLLAHWPFDTAVNGIVSDISGSGYDGSTQAAEIAGQIDGALSFNGSSDYVNLPSINVSGDTVTLAMWIYANSFSVPYGDNRIISKATSQSEQDHVWMLSTRERYGSHYLRFRVKTEGFTDTLIGEGSGGAISLNTWYHTAAVYDGSEMRLYVDGMLVGTRAKTGDINQNSALVNIGRNPNGYGHWHGAIDDVRIYSSALSQSDILDLMDPGPPNVPPTANLVANPLQGVSPLTTSFDGSGSTDSDGTIASYDWDFGDGNVGSGAIIDHQYSSPGFYTAVLVVTDNDGATDQTTITVQVDEPPNTEPTAVFSASPTTGPATLDVFVDASGSFDTDGTIVSYEWNFGDGVSETGITANHLYSAPGTYTITLVVTDDDGANATATATIEVDEPPNQIPSANFTVTTATVSFDGSTSLDSDGTVVSYDWDFGDGTTGSGVSPTHGFGSGSYSITLTVIDNEGGQNQTSHTLVIP